MKKNDLYGISYEMKKQLQLKILAVVSCIIFVFVFLTLIIHFLFFTVQQKSVSMEPTLSPNACVFVSHINKKIKRGDSILIQLNGFNEDSFVKKIMSSVVAFITGQKIYLDFDDKNLSTPTIRRVVGMPGDTIYMIDYVLYIKPVGQSYFLTEFEYMQDKYNVTISASSSNWDFSLGTIGRFDPIVLGADEYFVLGDNRNVSSDSRLWGPVKRESIFGKALFQYFPFTSLQLL